MASPKKQPAGRRFFARLAAAFVVVAAGLGALQMGPIREFLLQGTDLKVRFDQRSDPNSPITLRHLSGSDSVWMNLTVRVAGGPTVRFRASMDDRVLIAVTHDTLIGSQRHLVLAAPDSADPRKRFHWPVGLPIKLYATTSSLPVSQQLDDWRVWTRESFDSRWEQQKLKLIYVLTGLTILGAVWVAGRQLVTAGREPHADLTAARCRDMLIDDIENSGGDPGRKAAGFLRMTYVGSTPLIDAAEQLGYDVTDWKELRDAMQQATRAKINLEERLGALGMRLTNKSF
jgi:hypothetical protein